MRNKTAAFTLIEVVAVITILGVLAVISVPSIIKQANAGREMNLEAQARSLYLAAQSALSENRQQCKLLELESKLLEVPSYGDGSKCGKLSLYPALISNHDRNAGNSDYLYYLTSIDGQNTLLVELLRGYTLDTNILYQPICLELNVKTGIVKAIAITDRNTFFVYESGTAKNNMACQDNRSNNEFNGFYGIADTGEIKTPSTPAFGLDIRDEKIDGKSVLLVEAKVPIIKGFENFVIELYNIDTEEPCADLAFKQSDILVNNLASAVTNQYQGQHIVYVKDKSPEGYTLVWVLDYVALEAGIVVYTDSIAIKYPAIPKTSISGKLFAMSADTQLTEICQSYGTAFAYWPYAISQPTSSMTTTKYFIENTRHLSNLIYIEPQTEINTNVVTKLHTASFEELEPYITDGWLYEEPLFYTQQ